MDHNNTPSALLSLRTAVILLAGLHTATLTGALTYLGTTNPATAALAAITALGTTIATLHNLITNT